MSRIDLIDKIATKEMDSNEREIYYQLIDGALYEEIKGSYNGNYDRQFRTMSSHRHPTKRRKKGGYLLD